MGTAKQVCLVMHSEGSGSDVGADIGPHGVGWTRESSLVRPKASASFSEKESLFLVLRSTKTWVYSQGRMSYTQEAGTFWPHNGRTSDSHKNSMSQPH